MDGTIVKMLANLLKTKSIGNIEYGNPGSTGGLYYWEDLNKYIYRGGSLVTYVSPDDQFDTTTNIDNYIKVPWENNTGECTENNTDNPCWRIISVNNDNSITIIRDRNINNEEIHFDNAGYGDLLENPNRPNNDKSTMYYALYGEAGYQSTLSSYYHLLQPLNVCLNKVSTYARINHSSYATYLNHSNQNEFVVDTCNITNKTNTIAVAPLQNQYVRLIYAEEYLNASLESTCTSIYQTKCRTKNYLYTSQNSWSLNSSTDYIDYVYAIDYGNIDCLRADWFNLGIRPVVVLKPTTKLISGDGSVENPYVIQ